MKTNKNRNYFLYLKLIKTALIGILLYTVIVVIYTYYSYKSSSLKNPFDESEIKKKSLKHDIIYNPSFHDLGKDGEKFFVNAKSAKKNKSTIEMNDIDGYFKINQNQSFQFKAFKAEIFTNKKLAVILGKVNINSKQSGEIDATDVLVYYKSKKIVSDKPVKLYNDFADIQAQGFEVKNENIIDFKGPVRTVISEYK